MKYAPNTSATVIGTTAAQVAAKFPGVISGNFAKGGDLLAARMTSADWAALGAAYSHVTGSTSGLDGVVSKYAPHHLTTWRAANKGAPIPVGPAPTLDMTLYEIYLEFRTAAIGSLSVEAALYETAAFAGANLGTAFGVGLTIGTGIDWLIQTLDPPLWNMIGDTEGTIVGDCVSLWEDTTASNQTKGNALFYEALEFGQNLLDSPDPLVAYDASLDEFEIGDWGDLADVEFATAGDLPDPPVPGGPFEV